jgi:putative membrane protein
MARGERHPTFPFPLTAGILKRETTTMSDLNDPRVYLAAERTLLAWNRTSVSLMAFGFVIERFGLFLQMAEREEVRFLQRNLSFVVGIVFILLAAFLAGYSAVQYNRILKTLRPTELPDGYNVAVGMITNVVLALLGVVLVVYMVRGIV